MLKHSHHCITSPPPFNLSSTCGESKHYIKAKKTIANARENDRVFVNQNSSQEKMRSISWRLFDFASKPASFVRLKKEW